jgi:hypothetical protein
MTEIIGNIVQVPAEFLRILSKFWSSLYYAEKNISITLVLKGTKLFACHGRRIINLPGAPTCLLQAMISEDENMVSTKTVTRNGNDIYLVHLS